MAFTKAPSQSTYQNKDVKLIWAMSNRDSSTTKDPLLQNGFYDVLRDKAAKDEDYYVIKRDGCVAYPRESPTTNIRGLYYWEDEDKLYISYDNKLDIITASNGTLEATHIPFVSTTGEVGFTEFYYEDGTTKVIVGDGTLLVSFDSSNTPTICTDPDLPPFLPSSIVFLDGYLFLVKAGTADIYNSDLNDPLAWTSGDFISAEMLPDTVIRISRLNNYLIVLGSSSIEYFFDAGNASGSPLQRNDTPVKQVGFLGGFTTFGNKVLFIGQYANTAPEVFILEDFKMDEINLPPIRRLLQQKNSFSGALVTNGGHDFYLVTTNGQTYALDLETRLWSQWSFQNTALFDIRYAFSIYLSVGYVSMFSIKGDKKLYFFDPERYQDNGVPFTFSATTQRITFDTMNRKFMSRLLIHADKTPSTLSVSWTDDDYQTFSSVRSVSMNSTRPAIYRLGHFFTRAFKVSATDNYPCRLMNMEVAFNIGAR